MNDSLKYHIEKITKLPTLPIIAQEILSCCDDNLASVNKLERIIENDPAISAKVLSTANSAFFGIRTPVTTLGSAISRIGFNNVRGIALGISLMTIMGSTRGKDALNYNRIFNHSLSTGFVSKILSIYLNTGIKDEALISGILHDIGFMVLCKYFPHLYYDVIERFESGLPFMEAEKQVMDFTHSEIGHWLAGQWKLPDNILEATLYHHAPSHKTEYAGHVAIIHLADYLTSTHILSMTEKKPGYTLETTCLDILGISEKDIIDFENEVKNGAFFNRLFQ